MKKDQKKMGRPPKSPQDKRGEKRLPVRFTDADIASVRSAAESRGKSLAEYVRSKLGLG